MKFFLAAILLGSLIALSCAYTSSSDSIVLYGVNDAQRLYDLIGDLSKSNGLEQYWRKAERPLRLLIAQWKRQDAKPDYEKSFYGDDIDTDFGAVLRNYFAFVGAENPKVVHQIKQEAAKLLPGNVFLRRGLF